VDTYGDDALAHSKFRVYTTWTRIFNRRRLKRFRRTVRTGRLFRKAQTPVEPGTVQASLIAVDPKNGHVWR